jgi:hypothetical protein
MLTLYASCVKQMLFHIKKQHLPLIFFLICYVVEMGGFFSNIFIGPVHFYLRDIAASLVFILAVRRIFTYGKGLPLFVFSLCVVIAGVVLGRNLGFPFLMPLGYLVALGLIIHHGRANQSSLFSGKVVIFVILLVLLGAFVNGILLNGLFKAGVSFRTAFYFLSFLFYYGVTDRENSVFDLLGYANIALLTTLTMWILRLSGIFAISTDQSDFGMRYVNAEEASFAGFACISYLSIFFNMRKGYWQFPMVKKNAVLFLFALSLCLVIMARHRTVWVCMIISIFVLYLFHYSKIALVLRLLLLGGFLSLFFICGIIKSDNNIILAIKDASNFSEGNTFTWRLEAWQQLINVASVTNPVSGVGYGREMTVSHYNSVGDLYDTDTSAHNLLIQVFGDAGLIGVITFIFLYAMPIVRSLRNIKNIGKGDTSFLCALITFWIMYSITYQNTIITGISLAWGTTGFLIKYRKRYDHVMS